MPKLYEWHISNLGEYTVLNGVVTGHISIMDGTFIHTSPIEKIEVCEDIIKVQTMNTLYECIKAEMNVALCKDFINRKFPIIDGYADFRAFVNNAKYLEETEVTPVVATDSVLMIIGNNRRFYYGGIWVNINDCTKKLTDVSPHIGMFQDSILCFMHDFFGYDIDIRYFPYQFCNLEFYSTETSDLPLYIENCGNEPIRVDYKGSVFEIQPSERKLITEGNADRDKELTNRSDMYPAGEITSADLKIFNHLGDKNETSEN